MFNLFFLFALMLGGLAATPGQAVEPPTLVWQEFGRGLSYGQLDLGSGQEETEKLLILKIDPNFNAFRVWHGPPRSIHDWQEQTGASIIVNGGYFTPSGEPCGLVVSEGRLYGPKANPAMKGMFVAEPKGISPDLPRATILDLAATKLDWNNLPWNQGLMSYPLLLDAQGRIRVKKTNRRAPRTAICTDRQGNILVVHCPGYYFSLYELAKFLQESPLNIEMALNLDGGSKAQLLVHTKNLTMVSPPWLAADRDNFPGDRSRLLPTVIGIIPRQD